MTSKEILEGNKIIAEFMGETVLPIKECDLFPLIQGEDGLRQTKYHTSWDWLMPACYKWENLQDFYKTNKASEYRKLSGILGGIVYEYVIEPVYIQLVENIKWYNQTKS